MIKGIGIDIIEKKRIKKLFLKYDTRFLKMLYHPKEIALFEKFTSSTRKIDFLAGRFATKEAYSKALQLGMHKSFKDIVVLNLKSGQPYIEDISLNHSYKIHVSISHNRDCAVSQVILESL